MLRPESDPLFNRAVENTQAGIQEWVKGREQRQTLHRIFGELSAIVTEFSINTRILERAGKL